MQEWTYTSRISKHPKCERDLSERKTQNQVIE